MVQYCLNCGYDLRGMPDGEDVCSECGARMPAEWAKLQRQRDQQKEAARIVCGCLLIVVVGIVGFILACMLAASMLGVLSP